MKRIMIAIHALSHDGAEHVAVIWAEYLLKQGHEVSFLVKYHIGNEKCVDNAINVFSMAETKEAYCQMSLHEHLKKARQLIRTNKPDILISFLPTMQILMMLATVGMRMERIETIRNNPWEDTDVGRKRFFWDLCFRRADKIILQTTEQGEYFPEKVRKKCVVIRNPITAEVPTKVYEESSPRRFVAVGRLNGQKNYPMMVRAFAKVAREVPGCTLDIFGSGTTSAEKELTELISAEGMRDCITLCGRVNNITGRLPEYDAFLMSSNYEGMSNALAEAMAAGLVCVATNCKTGPKDLINDEREGYLTHVGDVEDFSKAVRKVTTMSGRVCAEMGQAARKKILQLCSRENTLVRIQKLIGNGE